MRDAKQAARISAVKTLIDKLEAEFDSLRKAAKELDIPHQNLSYWRQHAVKQKEFIEAFEKIRVALKIPKSKMWALMLDEET